MTDTLTLNLADGSVAFACSLETAQTLKSELQTHWASLKTIAASANTAEGDTPTKPSPQPTLEYRQVGDVFLEVFCNPNIWPTPFAAKLLITIRDDRIRVTTEASLNQILEDLSLFLDR